MARFLGDGDAWGAAQSSPVAVKFLLRALWPARPMREIGEGRCRELRALAESADLIVSGKVSLA
eukprot:3567219-Pyramimonas_sp.AAC.1